MARAHRHRPRGPGGIRRIRSRPRRDARRAARWPNARARCHRFGSRVSTHQEECRRGAVASGSPTARRTDRARLGLRLRFRSERAARRVCSHRDARQFGNSRVRRAVCTVEVRERAMGEGSRRRQSGQHAVQHSFPCEGAQPSAARILPHHLADRLRDAQRPPSQRSSSAVRVGSKRHRAAVLAAARRRRQRQDDDARSLAARLRTRGCRHGGVYSIPGRRRDVSPAAVGHLLLALLHEWRACHDTGDAAQARAALRVDRGPKAQGRRPCDRRDLSVGLQQLGARQQPSEKVP